MSKGTLRFFVVLIIFLGTITILVRLTNLEEVVRLTRQSAYYYIFLAALLHLVYIVSQAELIDLLFGLVKVSLMLGELITFYLAAEFTNVILPSIGLSGLTIFTVEAKRHNIDSSKAVTIGALSYFINYLTFGIILGIGLIFLVSHKELSYAFTIPSVIMGLIILFGALLLLSAWRGPQGLRKMFNFFFWLVNRFSFLVKQKSLFSSFRIDKLSNGIHQTVNDLLEQKLFFWKPLSWGLIIHLSNILTLGLVFLAFHYPPSIGLSVTGYAIGWLTTIVSVTPSGVGFVEGAMVLVFVSLGVPIEIAVLVTTIYRGIVFWLPFLLGMIAFRRLKFVTMLGEDHLWT